MQEVLDNPYKIKEHLSMTTANILGSDSYCNKMKRKVTQSMVQYGPPNLFATLSIAETSDRVLNRLLTST